MGGGYRFRAALNAIGTIKTYFYSTEYAHIANIPQLEANMGILASSWGILAK